MPQYTGPLDPVRMLNLTHVAFKQTLPVTLFEYNSLKEKQLPWLYSLRAHGGIQPPLKHSTHQLGSHREDVRATELIHSVEPPLKLMSYKSSLCCFRADRQGLVQNM